ncbi:MAG: hypothetical protein C5B50_19080 [Verrucomicrobia bacterium]|nr:MAG: hypothetical protein C5B50_19080 [Verrucomicrobiota bacterium]
MPLQAPARSPTPCYLRALKRHKCRAPLRGWALLIPLSGTALFAGVSRKNEIPTQSRNTLLFRFDEKGLAKGNLLTSALTSAISNKNPYAVFSGYGLSIGERVVLSLMRLFIPVERRTEAAQILCMVQARLGSCADYLGSCVEQRDDPCSHIIYIERWKSEEALCDHIRSSIYRCILTAIELSNRAPEISFYFGLQNKGMDLIQALRGSSPEPNGGGESKPTPCEGVKQ